MEGAEIIQQQKDLPENFRQSAENLAQALPDGKYKDQVLQSLNNIQASLANNPEMLAKGGEEVYQGYKEFIRQGGEPEQYEAILNQEVLPLAKELNNLGKQAQDEIKQELTKYYGLDDEQAAKVAKTVLLTRESEKYISGSTSVNDFESCTYCLHLEIIKSAPLGSQVLLSNASTYKITLDNGKDIYFETGSNLAIKIFDKSAVVSYKVEEAIKRSGVDPQVAGLAISLALGGPVGLVKDLIIDTVAGDKIVLVSETLKNQVTAVVRVSDKEAVSQLTSDELKVKGDAQTLAISEQVQRTKDGVGFLAGVVGIGGIGGASKTIKIDGKDVELSKSGFEIGNENPVTGHKV